MKKRFLAIIPVLLMGLAVQGCNSKKNDLTIWVGAESVDFYTEKMAEYRVEYEKSGKNDLPKIVVKKADTGTAAATFLDDTDAGADIFTIAHDNLGKLTQGSSVIAPIDDEELLAQIDSDNPNSFKDVIKSEVQGQTYTFGVPYIAQSLVYYYNKGIISEEHVDTWEGIMEDCGAVSGKNVKATSLLGEDGYNNSFLLLARKVNEDQTTSTTVKIYENGIQDNCYLTGDDTVAVMKWGQDFFSNKNGGMWPSSSGWEVDLSNGASAGVIGGAWNYNAAKAALGNNFAVTKLPRFTISESQAVGTITAGTVFQSGTFADCKIFVMKKNSKYQAYLQDIIKFLTSKEVQEESFVRCANLPAYKNAATEFESLLEDNNDAKLAAAQIKMFEFGIPQPFGVKTKYNTYFYSKNAPEYIKALLNDKNQTERKFTTDEAIRTELQAICNIWMTSYREGRD